MSNSYHKSGTELSKKTLRGLKKCLHEEVATWVVANDSRGPVTAPPHLITLQHFPYWPDVVMREREGGSVSTASSRAPPAPVYYLHYVRRPLDIIFSGFFYHLRATESWLQRPSFPFCRNFSTHKRVIKELGHIDLTVLSSSLSLSQPECLRRFRAHAPSIPPHAITYQNFLRATVSPHDISLSPWSLPTQASLSEGLWMEAYRSLSTLLEMYVNLYTQKPNTLTHYTESAHRKGWELAYVEKVLIFLDIPSIMEDSCRDRLHHALRSKGPAHTHVTNYSFISREMRRHYEDQLMRDPFLGALLRKLEELVMGRKEAEWKKDESRWRERRERDKKRENEGEKERRRRLKKEEQERSAWLKVRSAY